MKSNSNSMDALGIILWLSGAFSWKLIIESGRILAWKRWELFYGCLEHSAGS